MAAPKTGIALVFGKPKGEPMPAGPASEDAEADIAELAALAFPGVQVDAAALKELIHACMETEY